MKAMRFVAIFFFGLAAVIIIIACTNPSSGIESTGIKHSVTYDLNGGEDGPVPVDTKTYALGAAVIAKQLPSGISAPAGKTSIGWNTRADGSGEDVAPSGIIDMASGGLTLYAKWVDGTYSVTYDLNGGQGSPVPVDTKTYALGAAVIAKPLPSGISVPAGKTFIGWNTRTDGSGENVASGGTIAMPSGGLTLYAKWVDRTYSVTYDLNGGQDGSAPVDTKTYALGAAVIAKPLPSGISAPGDKTFIGWNTRADGSGENVAPSGTIDMASGGLTLYAKWVDRTYSVTYKLKGGKGSPAPVDTKTYALGAAVIAKQLPSGIRGPGGRTFVGWNTRANGRGEDVAPGGTIAMPRGGLTLYAKWRRRL